MNKCSLPLVPLAHTAGEHLVNCPGSACWNMGSVDYSSNLGNDLSSFPAIFFFADTSWDQSCVCTQVLVSICFLETLGSDSTFPWMRLGWGGSFKQAALFPCYLLPPLLEDS